MTGLTLDDLVQRLRAVLDGPGRAVEAVVLREGWKAALPQLHALRLEVKRLGAWAPHLTPEHGGMGLSLVQFAQVSEVLGRSPIGHWLCNCQAPDIGNMELMHTHADPSLQARWLMPLMHGEIRSCFAMTEPEHAGSNPVWMSTTAVRDADDYVITGHKWFTTGADGAAFTIVMAVTAPDAPPHKRATMIVVPTDTPGFSIVQNIMVMGERGGDHASHAEVRFDAVRVPVTNRIGSEGQGFELAQARLGPGRVHHCMRWIGICERAFDLMCERAVQRELSPGEPLARRDTVQHWVAESRAEIDAARLLVLDAALALETRGPLGAREQISAIKFHTAAVLQRVLDRAIQVHGAMGLTDATPLAFWWAHERGARIYDGPDEVHKQSLGRAILKRYATS
ncbi:MAG: acyl-CoA dehydrogenase family protein [Gemmatimonadaceae bacterium]|nr:acyl-CoA dehydrogenase family protein [Gemmatimonadaceae bacterium]